MREFLAARRCEWCDRKTLALPIAIPVGMLGKFGQVHVHLCESCGVLLPKALAVFRKLHNQTSLGATWTQYIVGMGLTTQQQRAQKGAR